MVKKMKKYAKFVVCMALIAGLVAPSYAALSASDGSAFVTKAEFDSALADFNSRLTTFEAGINSKIDSQVSSYLDRNGIWNGEKQTLKLKWGNYAIVNIIESLRETNPELFIYNRSELDSSRQPHFLYYNPGANMISMDDYTHPDLNIDMARVAVGLRNLILLDLKEWSAYVELCKCTKSGLLFVDWELNTCAMNMILDPNKVKSASGDIINSTNYNWHPFAQALAQIKNTGKLTQPVADFNLKTGETGPYEGLPVLPTDSVGYSSSLNLTLWGDLIKNGSKASMVNIQQLASITGHGTPALVENTTVTYGIGQTIPSNYGSNFVQNCFVNKDDVIKLGVSVHVNGRKTWAYAIGSQGIIDDPDNFLPIWWAGYYIKDASIY